MKTIEITREREVFFFLSNTGFFSHASLMASPVFLMVAF